MPSSAQISPLRQVSQDIEDGGTPESTNTKSSRSSVKVMLSSKIRLSSLNIDKFDQALSPDFASSFEESEDCFHELTVKAATLLGAER